MMISISFDHKPTTKSYYSLLQLYSRPGSPGKDNDPKSGGGRQAAEVSELPKSWPSPWTQLATDECSDWERTTKQ